MEQRCEARLPDDRSLTITLLGERESRHAARVKNASGSGLGLLVATCVAPGTALRIELEDELLLGEVMYCRPMEEGYFIGVQLEQMLRGLREMRERFREFYETPVLAARDTR